MKPLEAQEATAADRFLRQSCQRAVPLRLPDGTRDQRPLFRRQADNLESGTNAGRVAQNGNGGQQLLAPLQIDGDPITDVYGPLYDGSQTALV
jgi:hypothetical protein